MGLHPSLKRTNSLGGNRSVMNRTERIKWLIEKGKWNQGDPVLGLPKIKIVKLKALKKEKQKVEEEAQPVAATPEDLKAPQNPKAPQAAKTPQAPKTPQTKPE